MTRTLCRPPSGSGGKKTDEDWIHGVIERFADYLDEVWGDYEREDPYTIGAEEAALEILGNPYTKKAYDILVRRDRGKINKDDESKFLEALWTCTGEINPRCRIVNTVCNRLIDGERIYLDPDINDKRLAGNRKLAMYTYDAAVALRYLIGTEIAGSGYVGVTEIREVLDLPQDDIAKGDREYVTIHDPKRVDAKKSPYDIAHNAGILVGHNFIWDTVSITRKREGKEAPPVLADKDIMNALQIVTDYCAYYMQKRKTGGDRRGDGLLGALDEALSPKSQQGTRRDRIYEAIGLLVQATLGKGPRTGKTTRKVIERLRRKYPEDKSPTK